MEQIHYNQAEHLRITNVEQFVPGRRYLMVHNRRAGEENIFAAPFCTVVWAIGAEFISFNDLERRTGRVPISQAEICEDARWLFFYATDGGYQSYSSASDHGFSDSAPGHSMNYILDLDDLQSREIEILREVSPGTNMTQPPHDDHDYEYEPGDMCETSYP